MRQIFFLLILSLFFGSNYSLAQNSIDTMRFKKVGEWNHIKHGNSVSHIRPSWRLFFNKKVGSNIIFRQDSSLYLRGTYQLNKDSVFIRHGKFQYFYSNGQLRDSGFYDSNSRAGNWKHFDYDGVLKYTQNHTSLIRTYYNFHGDTLAYGKMESIKESNYYEFYNLKDHTGYWVFNKPDGTCNCKGEMFRSLKHGIWKYYGLKRKPRRVTLKWYSRYVLRTGFLFTESCQWN